MKTILHALERHASAQPDKTAITGSHCLNWRQLHTAVAAAIPALAGCRTIGLHMANAPAWIVADLAAMAARIMNVPLPTFFSTTQLRHSIQDAQIDTIITDNPQQIATATEIASELEIDIAGQPYTQLFLNRQNSSCHNSSTVKLTYTSGTTGTPRGVRLGLHAIEQVTATLAAAADARADDRALIVLPLSILLENIGSVYVPIIAGAEIIVPAASELGIYGSSRVDVEHFAEALNRFRPTTLILPPHLLKLLVELGKQRRLPDSFRFIAVGGAPTGSRLLAAADALGLPVFQGYGLSEAASVVAVNSASNNRPGSVGKPLPHSRVRVAADNRLYVGGVTAEGYLNGTDFDADTELDTGDLGYLDDDGYLYVTGRQGNLIITGYGRNISPEWIESELTAHSAIAQAAVFGDDSGAITAVLVPAAADTPARLLNALDEVNARLPDYARIRHHVVTTVAFGIDSGELTPAGTLVRNAIAQRYVSAARQTVEAAR